MEIQIWREILLPYDLAVRELELKFQHLMLEYHSAGQYCPMEQVTGRVKSVPSILEKARRKGIPIEEIEEKIQDIAGIRLICQFVEDIHKVVELIRRREDMEVLEERDYVTAGKESGYRSYHMVISYKVQYLGEVKSLLAEIQIRTMAMNFWATIEHSLQYKYRKNMPEHIRERLTKSSLATVMLDQEMSSVRREIMDAQISLQMRENLVTEILNMIQDLYRISNRREIEKIQDEFYRIYELNDIEQLDRFRHELDVIMEGYRAQQVHFPQDL